jgi:hypothetical protein
VKAAAAPKPARKTAEKKAPAQKPAQGRDAQHAAPAHVSHEGHAHPQKPHEQKK